MDTPDNLNSRAKYEEWFLREVDKGISAADRGQFVDHSELRKLIDDRYPG
jgi:predicted transcriptional regulator